MYHQTAFKIKKGLRAQHFWVNKTSEIRFIVLLNISGQNEGGLMWNKGL